jgi:predicted Abi (CAAX) family protease
MSDNKTKLSMRARDWVLIGIIVVVGVALIPITIDIFFTVLLYMMKNPLASLGILSLMMISFIIGMSTEEK